MAQEAESKTGLEWACRVYCAEAEYLRKTDLHDNYTDRARSRRRQAEAVEIIRAALPSEPTPPTVVEAIDVNHGGYALIVRDFATGRVWAYRTLADLIARLDVPVEPPA